MKKIVFILLIVTISILADSVSAQNNIPPGSYRNKCTQAKVENTVLKGECYWEASKIQSNLFDFYLCDGDISVLKGKLTCNKNQNSALMKTARTAVRAAYRDATGSQLPGAELPWIREFFDTTFNATISFFDKQGLDRYEVQSVFQKHICSPSEATLRLETINRAVDQVYGKAPSPTETAFWNANCMGPGGFFNRIVKAKTSKMNENKITRRFMITAAFKRSYGRPAMSSELDTWTPLQLNFGEIVAANRGYMYSSQGAKELAATVERALFNKKGEKPSAAEISAAIVQYSGSKAIFAEM